MTGDSSNLVARVYALPGRATRAIVDLDAIEGNVRLLRANQRPGQGLMAVVKANGYGHGALMTAQACLAGGADRLGVATVGEAAELRRGGISVPILALGPIDASEVESAVDIGVELTVGSRSMLDDFAACAGSAGREVQVHVKVDTGMHRFGALSAEAVELIGLVASFDRVRLAGMMTHFATADDVLSSASDRQLVDFRELIETVRPRLGPETAIHANNSAASLRGLFPEGSFDRVGIAIYGLRPGPAIDVLDGMRPALSLVTRIARVHAADAGDGVSYGHTYLAEQGERLGLLPIGYADGYRRALSDRAWIRVAGFACPVRGRVCMDQTVAGDLPGSARVGDLVGLLGPQLDGPSMEDAAGWAGTISYEIAAGLSPRIPRFYVRGGRVVATLTAGTLEWL